VKLWGVGEAVASIPDEDAAAQPRLLLQGRPGLVWSGVLPGPGHATACSS
jgi:hypothetical protein